LINALAFENDIVHFGFEWDCNTVDVTFRIHLEDHFYLAKNISKIRLENIVVIMCKVKLDRIIRAGQLAIVTLHDQAVVTGVGILTRIAFQDMRRFCIGRAKSAIIQTKGTMN